MTKQEYESKIKAIKTPNAELRLLENIKIRNEYIESLEQENDSMQVEMTKLKAKAIIWNSNLPEHEGWYLAAIADGGSSPLIEIVRLFNNNWYRVDGAWYSQTKILYWAYLPEPPKEEMMPNELMKEKLWEIEQLQARIEEMEKQVKWHLFDIDNVDTYPPRADMYLTLSIPERTEYMEIDDGETYDVLWFELYSEEYWHEHNVTHWAYLPEPPKEVK